MARVSDSGAIISIVMHNRSRAQKGNLREKKLSAFPELSLAKSS